MKYYILKQGTIVFVKDEDFFISQGGLTQKWGKNWKLVFAESSEQARQLGLSMALPIDIQPMPNPCKQIFLKCTCDDFVDDACVLHFEENRKQDERIRLQNLKCDCGAAKANTTHAYWCSKNQ